MATLQSHIPASLRSNSQGRRANFGDPSCEESRPYLIAGRKGRTASTAFISLPKEPDDARITGATRSLDRRLLALNLRGSLGGSLGSSLMRGSMTTVSTIKTITGVRIA
jgi:hypothetical protein